MAVLWKILLVANNMMQRVGGWPLALPNLGGCKHISRTPQIKMDLNSHRLQIYHDVNAAA